MVLILNFRLMYPDIAIQVKQFILKKLYNLKFLLFQKFMNQLELLKSNTIQFPIEMNKFRLFETLLQEL